jgi:NAD(P)-dependent dehydrogenase (short-subunit alcohol dehydrogenase family)
LPSARAPRQTSTQKATEISKATGAAVIGVPVDPSKRGEPERLVREVVDRFGRLDVLVNIAGVAPGGGWRRSATTTRNAASNSSCSV